jgi:MFS family permease
MFEATAALKNPNYRLYFIGQLLSVSGTFMQGIAQSWLVYKMTGSAAWLGIITFCTNAPAFLFSPLAGAAADRFERRKILLAVQWLSMLQALALTALVYTNTATIYLIALLAILLGMINAFDMPTRHAFVVDMVNKEEMSHAIALNSIIMNSSRIIGPAIAGVVIGIAGEKLCFALNGLSYIAAIVALMKIVPRQRTISTSKDGLVTSIKSGARYVLGNKYILGLIAFIGLISFIAPSFMVLLPVVAKQLLHGDARTYSSLISCLGVGAIAGAFFIANETGEKLMRRLLARNLLMIGISFLVMAFSRLYWLSLGAAFAHGFFNMTVFPRVNNAIQQTVDDKLRGRVSAIYTMVFLGLMPLGSLLSGWLSQRIGVNGTLYGAGICCILIALIIGLRLLRPRTCN